MVEAASQCSSVIAITPITSTSSVITLLHHLGMTTVHEELGIRALERQTSSEGVGRRPAMLPMSMFAIRWAAAP